MSSERDSNGTGKLRNTATECKVLPFGRSSANVDRTANLAVAQMVPVTTPCLPPTAHAISRRQERAGDYVPDGDDRAATDTVGDFDEFMSLPQTYARLAAKLMFANASQAPDLISSVNKALRKVMEGAESE